MNDNLPLVTVVTVTFNLVKNERVAFFRQCVESVHAQDYPNIEHLVIDGASSDGTLDIIREYEQKGWLSCYSEPDKGIYDAMNKGIRLAKGKYIAFLNSDDFWHKPNGVSCSVIELQRSGATFSYAPRRLENDKGDVLLETEASQIGSFPYMMPFCHQTMFCKKDAFLKYGLFAGDKYKLAADYDFIINILMHGESCVYVPLNFTTFRLGGASLHEESMKEVHKVRLHRFGEKAALSLKEEYLDDDDIQNIVSRVDYFVALDIVRCTCVTEPGKYTIAQRR